MSIKNIKDFNIINEFKNENINLFGNTKQFDNTKTALMKRFPNINDEDCNSIINIMENIAEENEKENCKLIITAPNSFKLQNVTTYYQIEKLIDLAEKQILLTGYNISNYFEDFIDKIISKSQKGVLVKLYLNQFKNTIFESKIKMYIGKFLKVYVFNDNTDKMAALHAKIIMVDNKKTIISSANLSYHGLEKNIEIGCSIDSNDVANDIKKLFDQLFSQKIFIEIK